MVWEIKDKEHDQVWKCVVTVDHISFESMELTKRSSKKSAAYKMLKYLFDADILAI